MHARKLTLIALPLFCWSGFVLLSAQEKTQQAKPAQRPVQRPVAAAKEFLSMLDEQQKATAVVDYASDERVGWHFIPKETRKGLPLKDMNEQQQAAAKKLLRALVSQLGFQKANAIMRLESVLLELEGPKSEGRRDPQKYYFTVFSEPGPKADWGLSVEGHHLSLNFSLAGNEIVDSTPQFLGSNPAQLKENYGENFKKGMRVLGPEEQLGFELVRSLSSEQQSKAMLAEVPQEIRGAGSPQPPIEAPRGIAAADLSDDQKSQLRKLIETYSSKMRPGVIKQRWELIEQAGFDTIRFAWAGATEPGVGHYYAIEGSTFVIEFINVQADAAGNPANHIHCVWRDLQGDFNLPIAKQ